MDDRAFILDSFISNYTAVHPSKDENLHLMQCWRIQDCGHCVVSKHSCGWCPYSSTCVPLPKHGHLLSPIHNAHICPMPWQERWELRTAPFGCNCSTTTFLAALITCASTIVSLIVLWLLYKILRALWKAYRGANGGWKLQVIEAQDGERWIEGTWVRKDGGVVRGVKDWATKMGRWIMREDTRGDGRNPDELVVGENRPLLG